MTENEEKIKILQGRLDDVTAEKEALELRTCCDLRAANDIIEKLKNDRRVCNCGVGQADVYCGACGGLLQK